MGWEVQQPPQVYLSFAPRTSINNEAFIQASKLLMQNFPLFSKSELCVCVPIHTLLHAQGPAVMPWQAYKWYIYIFCINMNILRVNMGWSGNMWWDTTSKKAPRGEKPALVWLYLCFCGVRAEAQRPRCIQGKCDWGGEAAPNPSLMQGDVLFIRGSKVSSVFNSETTTTAAEGTTRFPVAPVHLYACGAGGTFALQII